MHLVLNGLLNSYSVSSDSQMPVKVDRVLSMALYPEHNAASAASHLESFQIIDELVPMIQG